MNSMFFLFFFFVFFFSLSSTCFVESNNNKFLKWYHCVWNVRIRIVCVRFGMAGKIARFVKEELVCSSNFIRLNLVSTGKPVAFVSCIIINLLAFVCSHFMISCECRVIFIVNCCGITEEIMCIRVLTHLPQHHYQHRHRKEIIITMIGAVVFMWQFSIFQIRIRSWMSDCKSLRVWLNYHRAHGHRNNGTQLKLGIWLNESECTECIRINRP